MAKANRTRTDRGRENKYVNETHCSGFCGEIEHLCPECADWGTLKSQEAFQRVDDDTRLDR
jgi:hypothetical protein